MLPSIVPYSASFLVTMIGHRAGCHALQGGTTMPVDTSPDSLLVFPRCASTPNSVTVHIHVHGSSVAVIVTWGAPGRGGSGMSGRGTRRGILGGCRRWWVPRASRRWPLCRLALSVTFLVIICETFLFFIIVSLDPRFSLESKSCTSSPKLQQDKDKRISQLANYNKWPMEEAPSKDCTRLCEVSSTNYNC